MKKKKKLLVKKRVNNIFNKTNLIKKKNNTYIYILQLRQVSEFLMRTANTLQT